MAYDDSDIGAGPASGPEGDPQARERAQRLEELVTGWLTLPEAAQVQGAQLREVRRQLKDHELAGVRRGEHQAVYVPAAFVSPDGPDPRLKGTFTVLRDGGMSDAQIIEWLFTPDPTLRVPGTPMDSLAAGFVTEVRRRAMEQAM